ncbi:putative pentatricopeptide repeat-containing protein At5g47460 [Coffea arabica]|uniref:Pentatricopeptide repeat-containing protein At5g47460 n=1 Tax=Coffea arabica TaxID=13443 RepID=A0A6P6TUF8_COFAR|nr:putative pentatricopeptide repeat-containing protein At5g47460 [Coffea arabica]
MHIEITVVVQGKIMLRFILQLKKSPLFFYQRKPNHFLLKQISTTIEPVQESDPVSWANTVSALAQGGLNSDIALLSACQMMNSGSKPNDYALVHLIRTCTKCGWFSLGQQLHCQIIESGHDSNVFVSAALINFYVKFELIYEAQNLFDEIPEPSLVGWNSLISGYVRSGQFRKSLTLFLQLEKSGISSDSYSCTAALSACGQLALLLLGKLIHSKIVKLGVEYSVIVGNCLIDMYGKCGAVEESMVIFDEMIDRDSISWNSVIAANARNGRLEQALSFLHQMTDPDTISYNEVISGIAQFGNIEDAIDLLSRMPNPNSSSWNSVITSYVNRYRARDALEFFSKMHFSGVQKDQFTYSSILSGIAGLSAVTWGMLIHCCTVKSGLDGSVVIGSALIDMYSKCGRITEAEMVFHWLQKKNLITWNTMISGYAHNGDSSKVLRLFEKLMLVKNLQPDRITFLNVLSACWHLRMPLDAANRYFELMVNEYRINPTAEHCSSMIRIMGQEGKVYQAEKMIHQLGFESNGAVWRALLAACVTCGNVKTAKVAAEKVMQLEGDSEYVYVLMSNVYACHEKWRDVIQIRTMMKEKGVRKEIGHSCIELENTFPTSSIL